MPNLADTTKPLRNLLSTKNQWVREQRQEKAFNKAKTILSSAPVLALFDPNLKTTVSSDASSFGLGAVSLQTQRDGLRPAYISRAMNSTEQRYAQIEKEALALTWACERFSGYLIGMTFHCDFTISHVPGKSLIITDALSRAPLPDMDPQAQDFNAEVEAYVLKHSSTKSSSFRNTTSQYPTPARSR